MGIYLVGTERATRVAEALPQVAEASSPRSGDVASACLLYHQYIYKPRTGSGAAKHEVAPPSLITKEIKMPLVQKTVNGTEYYTDDQVYYTFHRVQAATDTLWDFACVELGIIDQTRFTSQQTKDITDLAGIGPRFPTKFLLLKNGNAIPIVYLTNGSPNLQPNDIILRSAVYPVAAGITAGGSASVSTASVADRLTEIEKLHNRKLITDTEYRDQRAKIIAEL